MGLLKAVRRQKREFVLWRLRKASRSIPPNEGQTWRQGDMSVYVRWVTEEGNVWMSSNLRGYEAQWVERPEQWEHRVKRRWLERG